MIPLFLGITILNLLGLATAASIGYFSAHGQPDLKSWHLLVGVLATFICVATHCIVFTYFIATAKWVQHAVTVKQLDAALTEPTRSFKAQAFPAALLAIAITFATAIMGAAHDSYMTRGVWHWGLAIVALAVNLLVAAVEYRAIDRNARLIDRILAQINRV